jgi:HrpA-like RNA helicase
MSATLEVEKFSKYFGSDAVVKVEGRAYPIEVYQTMQPQKDYMVTQAAVVYYYFLELPCEHSYTNRSL